MPPWSTVERTRVEQLQAPLLERTGSSEPAMAMAGAFTDDHGDLHSVVKKGIRRKWPLSSGTVPCDRFNGFSTENGTAKALPPSSTSSFPPPNITSLPYITSAPHYIRPEEAPSSLRTLPSLSSSIDHGGASLLSSCPISSSLDIFGLTSVDQHPYRMGFPFDTSPFLSDLVSTSEAFAPVNGKGRRAREGGVASEREGEAEVEILPFQRSARMDDRMLNGNTMESSERDRISQIQDDLWAIVGGDMGLRNASQLFHPVESIVSTLASQESQQYYQHQAGQQSHESQGSTKRRKTSDFVMRSDMEKSSDRLKRQEGSVGSLMDAGFAARSLENLRHGSLEGMCDKWVEEMREEMGSPSPNESSVTLEAQLGQLAEDWKEATTVGCFTMAAIPYSLLRLRRSELIPRKMSNIKAAQLEKKVQDIVSNEMGYVNR